MTRKKIEKSTGSKEVFVYVETISGGPKKFYNRRRIKRKAIVETTRSEFQPITSEWFQVIIDELPNARRRQQLSQAALAQLLGTNQAAISRLEAGKSNPTAELLDRLFIILKLDPTITFTSI